jgi:hypothetical protein
MKQPLICFMVGLSLAIHFTGCKPTSQTTGPTTLKNDYQAPPSFDTMEVRWDESQWPLSLNMSDVFTSTEQKEIEQSFQLWKVEFPESSFVMDSLENAQLIIDPQFDDLDLYEDGVVGIYKKASWFPDLRSNILGITQYYGERYINPEGNIYTIIHEADIFLNGQHFSFASTWPPAINQYDLRTVVAHEWGHVLGLAHVQNPESLMYSSLGKREVKHSLNTEDRTEFHRYYRDEMQSHLFFQKLEKEQVDGMSLGKISFMREIHPPL